MGTIGGFDEGYTGFSAGRELILSESFNLDAGLKYALTGHTIFDFVNSERQHIVFTLGVSLKF